MIALDRDNIKKNILNIKTIRMEIISICTPHITEYTYKNNI
jgi:hypothetical protein